MPRRHARPTRRVGPCCPHCRRLVRARQRRVFVGQVIWHEECHDVAQYVHGL